MNLDLTSYLKIYQVFDEKFCADTIGQLKTVDWQTHGYTNPSNYDETTSYENEFLMCTSPINNEDAIMDGIWRSFQAYCTEINFPWFTGWSGHSRVRFNKYDVSTLMREHCDHIHSLFTGERRGIPTITALGALNNNYAGGELVFWQDKQVVIPPGHIAVFPSNFLYPHYVAPVKEGVRYSYVSWAW
jgi:predicted 2-oxoglutarate/Fe(II)-dependent dioxygenase YbiX